MPTSGKRQLALHARSTPTPARTATLLALFLATTTAAATFADSRGRGSGTRGISSRSAPSRSAPSRQATSLGRYRNHGQARGSSGAPPMRQPNLPVALSGIGTAQHIERSRTRIHQSGIHVPRRGHFGHHRAPQIIYVPVSYAPAPDPIIVVQQAPPPQPVVVTIPAQTPAPAPTIPPPPPAPPRRTSTEPGTIRFTVLPPDAELLLDDLRLGTPAELLATGKRVAPGIHVLEVTHPFHTPERVVFAVDPGASTRVFIDLREERPSRRTRIE